MRNGALRAGAGAPPNRSHSFSWPFVYYGHEKLWERFGGAPAPARKAPLRIAYAGA